MSAPAVITRYLAAAPAGDFAGLADCFTVDGTVTDEGHTYRGRAEIIGWRESLASQFTYTATITSSESINNSEYRVTAHLVGDFPGGVADLTYRFILHDGLIADLTIGE
jgi:SnoaL-like domain